MPKFYYTLLILNVGYVYWFFRWLQSHSPAETTNILIFLVNAFFLLGITFSILVFPIVHQRALEFLDPKKNYRRVLKWCMFVSAGVTFVLALRAYKVFNLFNLVLFLVLYGAIFVQLRSKR